MTGSFREQVNQNQIRKSSLTENNKSEKTDNQSQKTKSNLYDYQTLTSANRGILKSSNTTTGENSLHSEEENNGTAVNSVKTVQSGGKIIKIPQQMVDSADSSDLSHKLNSFKVNE